ncbi:lytic transglycosylase domain-containing protein [Rahnella aceris]|uniref:lytic transglycosylase domain-containing protein n=1 Tax=Rahnella sp. (strain Y9602) TaxID=2703885 RepID=UPI001903D9D3|nr:lytic transglycosylase domain-containing protein [Rahnella aceris]QQN36610.1 lytic transglycosylase domain-containing protein [Rahnella aceris]
MACEQLPVLTLDFDESKIKALQDISDKFKAAFAVGPGGFPMPQPAFPAPIAVQPGETGRKRPEVQNNFDKFMKTLNKEAQGTLKTYTLINKTLAVTTSTLKGLFTETVSWGAKIAAIAGGGLFGYGFMAQHVSNQYKSSQGLGITTGQMQAVKNVYGTRISGSGNIMQTLAAAQNDPSNPNYAGLVNMGMNPQDGAAANMPKLLSRVSQLLQQYKGTGVSQTILKATGLDGLIDVATANQVLANSDRLPQLNQQFTEQSQRLDRDMGSGTQESWQALSTKFMTNADSIGNTFLKVMARLNKPIGDLSDVLTADIEQFLNGRNGKALFDTLADGLEKLGKWLSGPDFQNDLTTFETAIKSVAAAIGDAVTFISGVTETPEQRAEERQNKIDKGEGVSVWSDLRDTVLTDSQKGLTGENPFTSLWHIGGVIGDHVFADAVSRKDRYVQQLRDQKEQDEKGGDGPPPMIFGIAPKSTYEQMAAGDAKKYDLPSGLFSTLIQQESGFNPQAYSAAGAMGLGQLTAGTAKSYGLSPSDVWNPEKNLDASAHYLSDNLKRYGGDIAKTLAQYNGGNIAVGKNDTLSMKKETVDYLLKILPQVKGRVEQHPDIMRQLRAADALLSRGGKNDRATIHLEIGQMPGAEIGAQVKGIYNK